MKLAIISHTEHYLDTTSNVIKGWAPTVAEINNLLEVFDEIYHVAMLVDEQTPNSTMAYSSSKIKFVPIPLVGGKSILKKTSIVFNAPKTLLIITKVLKKIDYFQLRTPTGIGVYLIPYLTLFVTKKGWYKYAGNWNQKNPPLGYALQRWMLKGQSRKVTINGRWEDQPKHCITFENPCLSEDDIIEGSKVISSKKWLDKITFCFVGRLEREKGVERIIQAFTALEENMKIKVDKVHLVGNGDEFNYFKNLANESGVNFVFHGYTSRLEVFNIYKESHVFLLPSSASEGFPKVIAEAINYGCIPIVSNISSINQYIKDEKNGYILSKVEVEALKKLMQSVLKANPDRYYELVHNSEEIRQLFTYSRYNNKIVQAIL